MSKIKSKISTYQKGKFAEHLSCLFLMLKGYKILAKRFKTPVGEVDIVASKKNLIVAVEIKYRSTQAEAKSCISLQQQQRIMRAINYFQQRRNKTNAYVRCDVIALAPKKWPLHIQNAWQSHELGISSYRKY